jgi:hypothetical protein
MLRSEKEILLFTTCGHLIHEACLLQNISGNRKFGANYPCFLCKKVSNLRLPLTDREVSLRYAQELASDILTADFLQKQP